MIRQLFSCMLGWLLSIHMAVAATTPIILVHGFLGFGRDELLGPQIGFHYWGGFFDIETNLREQGYLTYTASIGPVSSNWDRACELYAQIKGGQVDYGAAHAAKYGHARYGRTYPGFYPEWGQTDPTTGRINKVHLIGHSQGGQTVRVLTQLLAEGDSAEQAFFPADDLSPLFKGQSKPWIASVTTLAAPHDGTTLVTGIINFSPFAENLIKIIIAITGSSDSTFFDFKLDQWGLKRDPRESLLHYTHRVMQSNIWTNTKDISAWDLSPEGAMALNRWVKAQPDVYYFSWSADSSFSDLVDGHYYPKWDMALLLQPFSVFLGGYIPPVASNIKIDSSWWPNDGVVNTRSQAGPRIGSTDVIRPCSDTPQIGVWNYCGVLTGFDHITMIGLFDVHDRDPRGFFRMLATRLARLPQN
jgi:triacylglycerol lipase